MHARAWLIQPALYEGTVFDMETYIDEMPEKAHGAMQTGPGFTVMPMKRQDDSDQCEDQPQRIAAASVLLFRSDAVLLVKRASGPMSGSWSAPGGHVEAGETAFAAAARELREETGLTAPALTALTTHLVAIEGAPSSPARIYEIAVFAGLAGPNGEPRAAGDAADARFVPRTELPTLPTTPGLEALIEAATRLLANPDERSS